MRRTPAASVAHLQPPENPRPYGLKWLLGAGWLDSGRVAADLAVGSGSEVLERLHVVAAMAWCVSLGLPISFMEIAAIPLGVIALIRLTATPAWRNYRWAVVLPTFVLLLGWTAWQAITLWWSMDRRLGVMQFGAMRFGWTLVAFVPLLAERRKLIAAMSLGFLAFNVSQLVNHVGVRCGISWLTLRPFTDRNGGWWPEVIAGSMLVAALGLHLPSALMGTGRARVLGAGGTLVTCLGIFATGTRAAWIAAVGLTAIVSVVAILRRPTWGARARAAGFALVVIGVGSGAIWLTVGPSVIRRYEAARDEYRRAVREGDYDSDNGVRLKMKDWAIEAFMAHPVRGIGVGSYPAWVKEHADPADPATRRFIHAGHGHAHNAILQALATTGVVGMALLGLAWLAALVGGFGVLRREEWGSNLAGPPFALLGLLLVTPFDSIHVTAQLSAVMLAMIALCAPIRVNAGDDVGIRTG